MKAPVIDAGVSLPATFTTGYKRDLAIAREIIRKRRGATQKPVVGPGSDNPPGTKLENDSAQWVHAR